MVNSILKISVIIVSYNVKELLDQCLDSLNRSLKNIPSEIIIVDNNSSDGSVQMLKEHYPYLSLLESKTNLGFSGGNNLGIKNAKGEYLVLLNPDTVVQEDTFSSLLSFFDNSPDAAAATCKILNPDGTFSIDCRHSIPTPSIALWKVLGLSKLFPKSKLFGRYNLTYLDENDTYPVDAISGSFMMIKKTMVDKTGLLDEDFFMYCEDIDYCYRINQAGGKIYYMPYTQILHYKGESSKDKNLNYVITFNRSLYQFYKKHYHDKYFSQFKMLILSGIILRGLLIYSMNLIKKRKWILSRDLQIRKCLIVGENEDICSLLQKLDQRPELTLRITGVVSIDKTMVSNKVEGYSVVTSIDHIEKYLQKEKIDVIIFATKNIPYKTILLTMANLKNRHLEFIMVPGHFEYMIGKSTIERLEII